MKIEQSAGNFKSLLLLDILKAPQRLYARYPN
jgi:hypothetical protein